jgi:hypothetical protein
VTGTITGGRPRSVLRARSRRSPLYGIVISLIVLAALIALALTMSGGDPQVTHITTASALDDGFDPVSTTDTFQPRDTFFVSVNINNYRSDQDIRARWRLDGGKIGETSLETHGASGNITAGFSLSNPNPWPAGRYTVEIVFGDKIIGTTSFRVE